MRKFLFSFIAIFFFLPLTLTAQVNPGEVSIEQTGINRNSTTYIIDYNLELGSDVKSVVVSLQMSVDGGKSFSANMQGASVSGDIGSMTTSGAKKIYYDFANVKEELAGKQMAFKISVVSKKMEKKAKEKKHVKDPEPMPVKEKEPVQMKEKDGVESNVFVLASAGLFPQSSYGIMAGYVKKFGFYVKGRMNPYIVTPNYACTSDGKTNFGYVWTSGEKIKTRMVVTGGLLVKATGNIFPYVGGGYGSRGVYWKDINGKWLEVSDYAYKGVAIDAGVIFKVGPAAISVGINNTAFSYTEFEAGIGISF